MAATAALAEGEMEKCYGVAMAGQNDCAAGPARPAPAPRRSTIRAMRGKLVPAGTCITWNCPKGGWAALRRWSATCPRDAPDGARVTHAPPSFPFRSLDRAHALPASAGIGFKPEHFDAIRASPAAIGFIEVHAENYMGAGGLPHHHLSRLRRDHALSLHGVGLSIGGAGPLDAAHLRRLRALCDRYEPDSFSEHLAWSSHGGAYLNDLLPLPYTEETLAQVCAHVSTVQEVLGRRMLLENHRPTCSSRNPRSPRRNSWPRLRRARAAACCWT